MPDTRPGDFTVLYEWQEGSLPPPYHYEYTIDIQPDGQGEVTMIPDYPSDTVPTWTEAFTVEQAKLDELYQLMVDKGMFSTKWQAQDMPPVGGGSDSLTVTAQGSDFHIPYFVIVRQATAASEIVSAVAALVPREVWDKLDAQREQYVQEHGP